MFKLCIVTYGYMLIYIWNFMCMFYLFSSPYLRVFGDDRVCDTREQMLLMQVAQVKLSRREGFNLGNFLCLFIAFKNSCKPLWVIL